jgi:hypothetical protein
MAAPATTPRGTPSGIRLDNGFKTTYSFSRNTTIGLWEKTVKPMGWDGGEAIPTSTQLNTLYHSSAPRALIKSTPAVIKVAYDPLAIQKIRSDLLNQPGAITERYPDGSTLDYFGFVRTFDPDPLEEGKQPEASITIEVTNYDPTNRVEAAPVLTSVSGT